MVTGVVNPVPYRPARVNPFDAPEQAPGFWREASTQWTLGWANQAMFRAEEYFLNPPEEGFNPWAHLKGYEQYAGMLTRARSTAEVDAMKRRIDFNLQEKDIQARGEWGLLASLTGGLSDPVNLVPIPIARGLGFVKGAAVGGTANAALTAVSDPIRIATDPTADWNELAYSIGGAALFGAALGGVAGRALPLSKKQFLKGRADMDRLLGDLSALEGVDNLARPFDGTKENYNVIPGHTGSFVDGRYEPVKVEVVEVPVRQKPASDGNLYHYDDSLGWVLEADRGIPDPRPVSQDILDELGMPERTTENRMTVDEAALKEDFEQGRTGLPDGEVKTASEFVTFKQIEADLRRIDPQQPNETKTQWQDRTRAAALEDLKRRRVSNKVARRGFLAPLLDNVNFSPVAKMIRLAPDDNILSDVGLQIAGDYGWMTRGNEFGQPTPPSLLLRAMRHGVSFNDIRQALDAEWLKYAQRNAGAEGKMLLGQNVSAAAEAMKARGKQLTGQPVVTREVFARMVGRAVFDATDFEIDGHRVVPEARAAAKAWVKVAQKFDAEAREAGIFYDQTALERTKKLAEAKAEDLKSKMAAWLWGKTGEPSALKPAIRVKVTEKDFKTPEAGIYAGYHGTTKGFTKFAKEKLGEFTKAQSAKEGFFFSKTVDTANTYSEAEKLAVEQSTEEMLAKHDALLTERNQKALEIEREVDKILVPVGLTFGDRWSVMNGIWDIVDNGNPLNDTPLTDAEMEALLTPEMMTEQQRAMLKAGELVRKFNDQNSPDNKFAEFFHLDETLFADFMGRNDIPDGSSVHPVKLVMTNPYVYDQRGEAYRERRFTEIVQTAKREGHDSVIIKNTYDTWNSEQILDDIYVVFDDSQIVSTFDQPGLEKAGKLGDREVDRVFTGDTHEAAMQAIIDAGHDPSSGTRGFVTKKTAAEQPKPMPDESASIFTIKRDMQSGEPIYYMDGDEVDYDTWANEKIAYMQEVEQTNAAAKAAPDRLVREFRDSDQLIRDRVASLTENQRRVYDDWQDDLDELEQTRAQAEIDIQNLKDKPHRFLNANGEPEPFFARFWNHTAIGAEREKFKKLLTAWYRRDNPNGAEQRAEATIDGMLKDGDSADQKPVNRAGLRHLHARSLDIPNSFSVEDPQLGRIAVADFINTDVETVGEAYIRGMGTRIEAAKMFGDAALWMKKKEIKEHWRQKYILPAIDRGASKEELAGIYAQRDEYLGWMQLTLDAVMGNLKTRDPWTLDNRIARNLKNYQILTSMGRVLLTSVPEAMRLPMVNGFNTMFGTVWQRMFGDAEKLRANIEFSRLSGELFDLVKDVHAARVAEVNTPDPSGAGTWIERQLQKSIPGFFKLVGLTHWTTIAKDLTMLGAQHKVMDLVKNPRAPGNMEKLAALGINPRDAKLLASMPTEQHGRIILPAVQNWVGADGRQARTLLLDAIHGEARRAIVTPSIADKSLMFSGLWTTRKGVRELGKTGKRGDGFVETDLMTLPLQFMSYGIAASQKVLMSGLQDRDQNLLMGAAAMMAMGMFSNYLKQPQTATMNKSPTEWLIEGYESSGVGAFWFSDLNQMLERYSYNTLGIRPLVGADPRFGKTTGVGDLVDAAGPSLGTLSDVLMAFADPEKSASNRAQAIRRAVPYNNVVWWGSITRDVANAAAKPFQ